VRLQQVIGEALQLMRASVPASVQLEAAIDSGAAMVLADQGQMHQVVINLVTNAAAALQGRTGTVGVFLGNLPARGRGRTPGMVRLRVTDDGVGMTPEVLERIFEPFFTTRPLGEGTGLGLAVVQGIVQDHGGQIFVRSEPGRGTTFDVELPPWAWSARAGACSRSRPAGRGRAAAGGGRRAGHRAGGERTAAAARATGHVGDRSGGRAGAGGGGPEDFDLLLTDLQMPRMDGVELAARVGGSVPSCRWCCPPGTAGRSGSTARAAGIREIVDKPFRIEELAHVLRAVLRGGDPAGAPATRDLTKRTTVRI
jgi:CheY-like chemotaxis protein